MEKFWLFGKKGAPAEDIDNDYNDIYYGKKSDDAEEQKTADEYDTYDEADGADVKVVLSEETAMQIAKAEEPLYKRTFAPESYADGEDIVDAFKDGRVAVICVENLDRENFIRLFDYLKGAVHALDGELRREDRETVVLLPYDFDEEISIDELDEEVVDGVADADEEEIEDIEEELEEEDGNGEDFDGIVDDGLDEN